MDDFEHYDEVGLSRYGKFARVFCAFSILAISGSIIHNAVFSQQSRVYSDKRISISAESARLDKLFSVLSVNGETGQQGRTRMTVQPVDDQPDISPAPGFNADPLDNKNTDVAMVQRRLIELDAYAGKADGVLSNATRQAIFLYQRRHGLPETGRPDGDLIGHLQFMHQIRQASSVTAGVSPANDAAAVEDAQRRLQALGYDPGPIDGRIGSKTEQAIRRFQADSQLAVTGELDKEVLSILNPARTSKFGQ